MPEGDGPPSISPDTPSLAEYRTAGWQLGEWPDGGARVRCDLESQAAEVGFPSPVPSEWVGPTELLASGVERTYELESCGVHHEGGNPYRSGGRGHQAPIEGRDRRHFARWRLGPKLERRAHTVDITRAGAPHPRFHGSQRRERGLPGSCHGGARNWAPEPASGSDTRVRRCIAGVRLREPVVQRGHDGRRPVRAPLGAVPSVTPANDA